ncbi:MAG: ThiF family adenylyltransferase [Legionellales bacterium]|nr:ThiF family adenylyltransferase [Legionellales bacterium]
MAFTLEEQLRYRRHFSLSEIGEDGQKKLKASCVAVVGAGGLGSPILYSLTAAGIGKIVSWLN